MNISFSKRKIHYFYIFLAVVSIVLAFVSYARAETIDMATPEVAGTESTKSKTSGVTGNGSLNTELQNRFINLVRNAFNRMDAAIARLENIATRLESRIAKLESEGIDTAESLSALNDAQNKLNEAKQMLVEAKAEAEDGLVSDLPRERFIAVREKFANIRGAIRDSYLLIRESLAELKDAILEAELNKSTGTIPALKAETVTP